MQQEISIAASFMLLWPLIGKFLHLTQRDRSTLWLTAKAAPHKYTYLLTYLGKILTCLIISSLYQI